MRTTLRKLSAAAVLLTAAIAAAPALAVDYYAKGTFNGWSTNNQLTDLGGGLYQGTVSGLTPGDRHEFKLATADWSSAFPGNNAYVRADAGGNITFYLNLNAPADGWAPATARAGFANPFQWEVMGSFTPNAWNEPVALTDLGGGVLGGQYLIPNPGNYEMKFRHVNDWDLNIGRDFAFQDNILFTTTEPNTLMGFRLDVPGGRYLVAPVPEPATMGLLSVGALAALRRRKA